MSKYSVRDLEVGVVHCVQGINTNHLLGLGLDGEVCCIAVDVESGTDEIAIPLIRLSICSTGGLIIAPSNKDLKPFINDEPLISEISLVSGSTVEVGGKRLQICEGEIQKPRRKLPPTPGQVTKTAPPRKPKRTANDSPELEVNPEVLTETIYELTEDTNQSEVLKHNDEERDVLKNLKTPQEIGNLAASYLTKQVNQYTDLKLTTEMADQMFKFLQEVAAYQKNILMEYLREMSDQLEEMPESERDRPVHKPAVILLVELLRQILDPMEHVMLCLQLLRTFSHFPVNLSTMISCQATAAVLGSMAVYKEEVLIQEFSLDILAKIALYKPASNQKYPLRETALELILRAMKHHNTKSQIVKGGLRTLANITLNLEDLLEHYLDSNDETLRDIIDTYEALLQYMFEESTQIVQQFLIEFPQELGIKAEGRRFLFNYSKMTQILIKKKNWSTMKNDTLEAEFEPPCDNKKVVGLTTSAVTFLKVSDDANVTKGILKRTLTTEETSDKKVHFVDETQSESDGSSAFLSDDDDIPAGDRFEEAVLEVQSVKTLSKEDVKKLSPDSPPPEPDHSQLTDDVFDDGDIDGSHLEDECLIAIDNNDIYSPSVLPTVGSSSNASSVLPAVASRSMDSVGISSKTAKGRSTTDKTVNALQAISMLHSSTCSPLTSSDENIILCTLQIVMLQGICTLIERGQETCALSVIDQPIIKIVNYAEGQQEFLQPIQKMFGDEKSLIDVDPNFLISLVDSIRYRSLMNDLVQKTMLNVISGIQSVKHHPSEMVCTAITCLTIVLQNGAVKTFVQEQGFITHLRDEIRKAKDESTNYDMSDLYSAVLDISESQ